MATVSHRRFACSVIFSEEKICVHGLLRRLEVPWSEIDFVSPTPFVEQVDGAWRFYKPLALEGEGLSLLEDRGRLVLDVVVKNRHALRRGWGLVRPFFGANDRPNPKRGIFSIDLWVAKLSVSPEALIAFVAQYARFELLCYGQD